MTNFLHSNLSYLRKKKGIIQADIQHRLGFVKNTWSNWENAKSQPNIENLVAISHFFEISLSDLIEKNLSEQGNEGNPKSRKLGGMKGGNSGGTTYEKALKTAHNAPTEPSNTDTFDYKNNVYDFESKAAAGEALLLLESDRMMNEPNLYLPHLGPGVHVRFPISGDSMHSTIKDSDKAVATLVTDISEVRQGHIYGILDKQEGLVCKRVYVENKTTLELVSDNEIYKPYKRHLKDIICLFRVHEVHSTDLRPYYEDIRKEMREIKSQMADILRLIGK